MKTVKTVNGVKRISDWDIPIQLSTILQEHRTTLIDKLLIDLGAYIDYKFSAKATSKQLHEMRLQLDALKKSGIDTDRYRPVFESVISNETTVLNNLLFYGEIDNRLKETLSQLPRVNEVGYVVFR
jgi:hypothetical protein